MSKILILLLIAISAWAQNPTACDLNGDGSINITDVTLAESMALGQTQCTSIIESNPSKCTIISIQRVYNASQGNPCITYNTHNSALSWTASVVQNLFGPPTSFVSGATGWNLYRSSTSGGPYTKLNSTSIGLTTSYPDFTVTVSATYYYVVTDTIPSGESPFSTQMTVVTDSIAGYNVYRSTTATGTITKLNSVVVAVVNYIDSTIVAGQTYFYIVRTVDPKSVESTNSNQVSAITPIP